MYKLTYDSDDDGESKIDGPPPPQQLPVENIQQDKYGATSPTTSRTQDRLKIKRDSTKKFYSLFANDAFVQDDPLKTKDKCCVCGIKFILSFLLFMTLCAAIAVFVVLQQKVDAKITRLERRVADLEGAFLTRRKPGQSAPKIAPAELRAAESEFDITKHDPVDSLSFLFFEHFDSTEKRFKVTMNAMKQMNANMKLHEDVIRHLQQKVDQMKWTMKLTQDDGYFIEELTDGHASDVRFTMSKASSISKVAGQNFDVENFSTISFENIMDVTEMASNDSFMALQDGYYIIIFTYCVRPSMAQATEISVVVNEQTERNIQTPPVESGNGLLRYKVALKLYLLQQDIVSLQVTSGAITEFTNATPTNVCTTLTVFKV